MHISDILFDIFDVCITCSWEIDMTLDIIGTIANAEADLLMAVGTDENYFVFAIGMLYAF